MIPIQAPETSLRLAKAFNVFGSASVVGLDQVVYPVAIVEDLSIGGTRTVRCASALTVGAIAAQFSFVILGPNLGVGNVLVRLRRFHCNSSSTMGFLARVRPNFTANPVLFGTRLDNAGVSAANYGGGNSAAITGPIVFVGECGNGGSGNQTATEVGLDGIVLRPGEFFLLQADTVNQPFTATMIWDEELIQ